MQNGYRFILNIILILTAFLAAGLLIFQSALYDSKSPTSSLDSWLKNLKVVPDIAASEGVLRHQALGNLKTYVVNFDFNRVCELSGVITCAQGNRLPFFVKPDESAVPVPVEVKPAAVKQP